MYCSDAGGTHWGTAIVGVGDGHVRDCSDPLAGSAKPVGIEVSGSDGWYRLALPLPLVERGDIALSRSGADLVVTVGDVRRRIALPSVLQRCTTEGASFDHGRLMIDFAADPALWPASLVAPPLVGAG